MSIWTKLRDSSSGNTPPAPGRRAPCDCAAKPLPRPRLLLLPSPLRLSLPLLLLLQALRCIFPRFAPTALPAVSLPPPGPPSLPFVAVEAERHAGASPIGGGRTITCNHKNNKKCRLVLEQTFIFIVRLRAE